MDELHLKAERLTCTLKAGARAMATRSFAHNAYRMRPTFQHTSAALLAANAKMLLLMVHHETRRIHHETRRICRFARKIEEVVSQHVRLGNMLDIHVVLSHSQGPPVCKEMAGGWIRKNRDPQQVTHHC